MESCCAGVLLFWRPVVLVFRVYKSPVVLVVCCSGGLLFWSPVQFKSNRTNIVICYQTYVAVILFSKEKQR